MKIKPKPAAASNCEHLFNRLAPIEYRKVSSLKRYPGNPRKPSQRQHRALCSSIQTFGFNIPVLVTRDGELITGEARIAAARELGLDEVPVIVIDHLTPAQIKAYRIADNRLAELGGWDLSKLRVEIEQIIDLGDVEIDLLGWETGELDVILAEPITADQPDPADEVPEREAAVSRRGDLWCLGHHRLVCGSSRETAIWERLLDGRMAAMVFSDPPYNVRVQGHVSGTGRHEEFHEASGEMSKAEFIVFLKQTVGNAVAHVKDGGVVDLCMDFRHMSELYAATDALGLSVLNLCVWDKGVGGMGSLYRSQHELVLITRKGSTPHTNNVQLGRYGRNRTNVWKYPGANQFGRSRSADLADHPTVKPTALVADAIRDVTHPGELVLDAFMGSGTTILAAERTKRVCYGVEIDGSYVDVAIKRWEKMTGGQVMLANTSESWAAVKARRSAEGLAPERAPLLALPAPAAGAPSIRRRPRPLAA